MKESLVVGTPSFGFEEERGVRERGLASMLGVGDKLTADGPFGLLRQATRLSFSVHEHPPKAVTFGAQIAKEFL